MGMIPPPPPVTPDELERRWNAGARTLFELDPALKSWHDSQNLQFTIYMICLFIGLAGILLTLTMVFMYE
jgi:hypothetical protein